MSNLKRKYLGVLPEPSWMNLQELPPRNIPGTGIPTNFDARIQWPNC
jgi:hypothetical protein